MAREGHFDASRAELFEALGHPVRVKILHELDQRPMGFGELKKATGIESSGHLQFHLGKLSGLISTTGEGDYVLTDDGKEAIRVLGLTSRGAGIGIKSGKQRPFGQGNRLKLLVVILLVALVALSGVVVYQQTMRPGSTQSGVSGFSLPASLCSSGPPPPTNQSTIDVYQIRPSSVAVICVSYLFPHAGSFTFTPTYGPYSSGGYHACGFPNGTNVSHCPDLNITSSQYSFQHSANQNVTVAYTVVTGKNITGLWWFFIGSCDAIPLAFGSVPSSVSYIFFGCVTSTDAPISANVTGFWNLNASAVRG